MSVRIATRRVATKLAVLGALSVLGATGAGLASARPASALPTDQDVAALAMINQTRAAVGECPLNLDVSLDINADVWNGYLAGVQRLEHNMRALNARWINGENVGRADSVARIHQLFVNSPGHYANITNAKFNYVGIGIVENNGYTYMTYDFVSTDDREHHC